MFGFLNINKPARWTSRDVVNHVEKMCRKFSRQRVKVGHAGTLDPLATGVLLICLGPATKLVPWLLDHRKAYRGTFLLGRKSFTDDVDGTVEEIPDAPLVTAEQWTALLPKFRGRIHQVPPQVSALKIQGERAYRLARTGGVVELPPREVEIHRLELLGFEYPEFALDVDCSSGTYIRALGRDLARELGTSAVMSALERTAVGPFTIQDAVPLAELSQQNIGSFVLPPLAGLGHLHVWDVPPQIARGLKLGRKYLRSELDVSPPPGQLLVTCEGRLVCVASCRETDIKPDLVLPDWSP